jgi:hypothetical protein
MKDPHPYPSPAKRGKDYCFLVFPLFPCDSGGRGWQCPVPSGTRQCTVAAATAVEMRENLMTAQKCMTQADERE